MSAAPPTKHLVPLTLFGILWPPCCCLRTNNSRGSLPCSQRFPFASHFCFSVKRTVSLGARAVNSRRRIRRLKPRHQLHLRRPAARDRANSAVRRNGLRLRLKSLPSSRITRFAPVEQSCATRRRPA